MSKFAGTDWRWLVSSWVKTDAEDTVSLWDWRSGKKIGDLEYRRGLGVVGDVSQDGQWAVIEVDDDPQRISTLRDFVIWDLEKRQLLFESPAYSSKEWLEKNEEYFYRYRDDKKGQTTMRALFQRVSDMQFSPDKTRLVVVSADRLTVYSIGIK